MPSLTGVAVLSNSSSSIAHLSRITTLDDRIFRSTSYNPKTCSKSDFKASFPHIHRPSFNTATTSSVTKFVNRLPQLGSGAIYKFADEDILVSPFPIPDFWPRCYGLDVGWDKTAAIWGARNPETGVIYLYSEYYRGQAEPQIHVEAIKQRGPWIPGVIDPASRGRSQKDGSQFARTLQKRGSRPRVLPKNFVRQEPVSRETPLNLGPSLCSLINLERKIECTTIRVASRAESRPPTGRSGRPV